MDLTTSPLIALARSPSAGAPLVLARGRLPAAIGLVFAAMCMSALVAVRLASETSIEQLFLPETRHPAVTAMIVTLGTERTAVVLYLLQRSFDTVVAATAATPLFVWLLGSTAVHASARVAGQKQPFTPILVLFGYAAALTLIPSSLASLVFGVGRDAGASLAQAIGLVCLIWLAVIAYRGVRAHYSVDRDQAMRILLVAAVLFYFVPIVLMVIAAVSIIIAALVLGYF